MLCLWLLPAAPAQALNAQERFALRVGEEAITIARGGGSATRVASRFQRSIRRYSSIVQLAEFSLGPYRRQLPASRRRAFYRLVERYVGRVFATYRGDFVAQRLEFVSSRSLGPRDTLVRTRLIYGDARAPGEVEWRIVRTGGRIRVFDLKVRGIWLTLQLRSAFVSIIKQNKGDIDALFTYLEKQGAP